MEQKCISSADIDSTGCLTNVKAATATDTPEKAASTAPPYIGSPQMSSIKDDLQQLQPHKKNACDKKIFDNYEILKQNSNQKEEDGDDDDDDEEEEEQEHEQEEGESDSDRGCSLSMSTPAADNLRLFKDDDSRSGSSDDVTTPHVDLHYLHQRHKQQQNGTECNDDETPTSTNTLQIIQDHRRCHELDNNVGGVGVGIYLETPVVDEQIVSLNSHDYEKAKPKRLSDEFLLSSEDCCDDERNSSNDSNPLAIHSSNSNKSADCSVSNSNISVIHKTSEILNDIWRFADTVDGVGFSESQFEAADGDVDVDVDVHAAPSGSMSLRFKNIKIDYNPFNAVNDGLTDTDAIPTDMTDNDVQSMDAIERRDFEHEQRLTGGIILKSSSIAKNDRLKLDLLQSNIQNAKGDERAVSSDSKCTYKDHSTTPTSSRHCNSRLTKSTAKINLTSSLSHTEIVSNGDEARENKESQNQENQLLDNNSTSPNDHLHHKVQQEHEPGSSKTIQESSLSSAVGSSSSSSSKNTSKRPLKLRSVALEGSVKNFFDLFSNGNSNDSLTSEHSYSTSSSHSLSHLTKQQEPPVCSGVSSSSSLNPDEELVKKDETEPGTSQALQQKSDVANDDDVVATTSSSARCQYPALKYIHNSQRKDSISAQNGEDEAVALNNVRPVQRRVISPASSVPAIFALAGANGSNFLQQLNFDAATAHHNGGEDQPQVESNELHENEFDEETWADCEEGSDEEICTCHKDTYSGPGKRDTSDMLLEEGLSKDVELSSYIQMVTISEDTMSHEQAMSPEYTGLQRKRKFNESRALDTDNYLGDPVSGRKRIAYDYSSTPRSSQTLLLIASPSTPLGRRTPRSLIPTRDNPPPELQDWLLQFQRWTHAERILAVDRLIEHCEPTQVRHMMKVIEPQFQRDFISLLPRELALQVLAYLDPKDLLRAAQTCRSWRFLCDDNLLWKEKCRKAQILTEPKTDRPKRGRAGNMPPIASPWKAAYMRQHIIESNWRSRPIREPKVLKGHDDHVITCLQFSGNRIVSGSDDNTLKVWSAVTGRCLRTLVGHTGGVWSSQMSGNIIISGSTDRTLKVWDMETGSCVHTLLGHTSTVRCMHLHGKKVVSGSRDATLRVWDIERGSCLHVLVGHLAAVRCVQYDGKLIVSGAYDYMVKIWHPERQECLHTLQGHTNRVYSLQFDGVHVVSGSLDTSIRVWDVETGNCKHTLMGHQSLTSGMELRQNILVSGNADSTVKVWDITNGQCLQTLSGPNKHQSAVTCLQFNSRFVITSSDDGTVKLWDVKTGEFIRNLVALDSGGSGGVVWRIRANDTKLICAVGSRNGTEETKLMVLDFDVEGACVKCS